VIWCNDNEFVFEIPSVLFSCLVAARAAQTRAM